MGLVYTDEHGQEKHPLIIHRAPLGTHERTIGFLIEHFGGAFPTWLAPVQVVLIPVADTHEGYAKEVRNKLFEQGIRVETYGSSETLGKRVRNADMQKVPYMLVLGDKEVESDSVCIRRHGSRDQTTVKFDAFLNDLVAQVKERKLS
jgi:threonyl-tRNA synthetase